MSEREMLRCSFCGRSQDECRRLITGSGGAAICDRCILACVEILMDVNDAEHDPEPSPASDKSEE